MYKQNLDAYVRSLIYICINLDVYPRILITLTPFKSNRIVLVTGLQNGIVERMRVFDSPWTGR